MKPLLSVLLVAAAFLFTLNGCEKDKQPSPGNGILPFIVKFSGEVDGIVKTKSQLTVNYAGAFLIDTDTLNGFSWFMITSTNVYDGQIIDLGSENSDMTIIYGDGASQEGFVSESGTAVILHLDTVNKIFKVAFEGTFSNSSGTSSVSVQNGIMQTAFE